jgi:hypothetical protein
MEIAATNRAWISINYFNLVVKARSYGRRRCQGWGSVNYLAAALSDGGCVKVTDKGYFKTMVMDKGSRS